MDLRSLTVGLDYLPAVCHPPGIGRYGRELVRAMVRLPQCPSLALFEWGGGERVMEGPPLGLEGLPAGRVRRRRGRVPRRVVTGLGRLGMGADRILGGVPLFHRLLPDYPPVSKARQCLPVPELPPEGSAGDEALGQTLRSMTGVFVFSAAYEAEVQRRYDLDPERVFRSHVGCEHWSRDLSTREVPSSDRKPRFLVLGAIRSARSPVEVLRAFRKLVTQGLDAELCFVGRPSDAADSFRRELTNERSGVTWIDDPVEADMPGLVAESDVLVHLAQEEGTPVTPLEAFEAGLAVVADPLPAFVEALGECATFVQPDRDDLVSALDRGLQQARDAGQREQRRRVAEPYRWKRTAEETLAAWECCLTLPIPL